MGTESQPEIEIVADDGVPVEVFPQRFGKFMLIKSLARGGMAEILLGKAQGPWGFEKALAIKRILPHSAADEAFISMFMSEAKIAARLHHPNIVQIYDLGRIDRQYFIAMEYIDGCSLLQLFRQARFLNLPFPLPYAVHIIKEAAAGLHHAHTAKDAQGRLLDIVHRDVSPSNVMISRDGVVKLVDFGVAKASNQLHQTQAGVLKGKYGYMSPEQCHGKPVDARSDIFALGVVLFECTTGTRLFAASNPMETLHRILKCDIPDPRSFVPDYPSALRDILFQMLAPRPEGRFQTAGGVHMALEAFLDSSSGLVSATELASLMQEMAGGTMANAGSSASGGDSFSSGRGWDSVAEGIRTISTSADSSVEPDQLDLPDVQRILSDPQPVAQGAPGRGRGGDRSFPIALGGLGLLVLGSALFWVVLLLR